MLIKLYLRDNLSPKDPQVSINYMENVSKFPPTLIISSEYDFLRVGNDIFAKKLHDGGVEMKAIRYSGCDHGTLDYFGSQPQAEDMILEMAEFIKQHVAV